MPHPERVNKQEVPAALPHGTGKVTVVDGGSGTSDVRGIRPWCRGRRGTPGARGRGPCPAEATLAEEVDHDGPLGDTQRVVPGEDNGGGAEVDIGAHRGQIGHQLQVVGAEGVVVEVVLDRP